MGPAAPPAAPAPITTNWLDIAATVHTQQRAALNPGTTVVGASYLARRVLLLLRDDSETDPARADSTRLILIGDQPQPEPVQLDRAQPARILPAPLRDWVAVAGFRQSAEGSKETAPVGPQLPATGPSPPAEAGKREPMLAVVSSTGPTETAAGPLHPGGELQVTPIGVQGMSPVLVGNDNLIYLRHPGTITVSNGLFKAYLDWTQPVRMARLSSPSTLLEVKDPAILASPSGDAAVGLLPGADPKLPGQWALYRWTKASGLESRLQTALPAAAGTVPDDAASLAWIDAEHIGVCYPAAAGPAEQNWTLVIFDSESAKPQLIADRLPPHTPVKAAAGVAFYCTPDPDTPGNWAIWAAGPDGLTKRKLYSAAAGSMLVLDATAAGLLVVVTHDNGGSSLVELSLGQLSGWNVAADALSLAPPKPAAPAIGPERPAPEEVPEATTDAGSRYRRRDQGPQLPPGAQPEPPSSPPADGGGGGSHPDLRLPGL